MTRTHIDYNDFIPTEEQLKRINLFVNKNQECWVWTGSLNSYGYGTATFQGKQALIHRLFYKLYVGLIKPGYLICHKCDNRSCCNPDHLYQGTPQQNAEDCAARGKTARGERQGSAKLTREKVEELRSLYEDGRTQKSLAEQFKISQSNVSKITRRASWF